MRAMGSPGLGPVDAAGAVAAADVEVEVEVEAEVEEEAGVVEDVVVVAGFAAVAVEAAASGFLNANPDVPVVELLAVVVEPPILNPEVAGLAGAACAGDALSEAAG